MSAPYVLVVDDNPANLRLVELTLHAGGITVRTARDAPEVLRELAGDLPRLILMDIQLPGIDGLELTRRLKADPRTAAIRIVALTAYAMAGDGERMRSAGCDDYLTKPIDVETLAIRVRDWMGST